MFLIELGERIGIGIGMGLIGAYILYKIAEFVDGQKNSIQDVEILVLVSVILIFSASNYLATESGVAAVAVTGLVLGNIGFTFKEDVQEFAEGVTPVVLSVVFIILAALVEIQTIIDVLWYKGLIVVLLIILVIRPLLVFVSTFRGLFTIREKMFISFVGPRGLIPASVASLFAIDLRDMGLVAEADILVSTVFLVIFATVFVEGGPARYIAEKLQINPMKIIIIGGGDSGKELADRLSDQRKEAVTIVESDADRVAELRNQGYGVVHGDGRDVETLKQAGIESAKILAAMTRSDDANMLSTQLARNKYDIETVVSRVGNNENREAFESLGVRVVSDSESTAIEADNIIDRPAFTSWIEDLDTQGKVVDIEMNNEEYKGETTDAFHKELPDNSLIALIDRDGHPIIPDGDTKIKLGDKLTFVARDESIDDIRFICNNR
jgi:Trk K+ transport system NAD-binding subunit